MYKISINNPGILITLPHNNKTIRTPYTFKVNDKDHSKVISVIKYHGISNYDEEYIEGDVIPEKEPIPKGPHSPEPHGSRESISLNTVVGQSGPGIKF
jgi:hypothetical protein